MLYGLQGLDPGANLGRAISRGAIYVLVAKIAAKCVNSDWELTVLAQCVKEEQWGLDDDVSQHDVESLGKMAIGSFQQARSEFHCLGLGELNLFLKHL
jgi:hypothetical protein